YKARIARGAPPTPPAVSWSSHAGCASNRSSDAAGSSTNRTTHFARADSRRCSMMILFGGGDGGGIVIDAKGIHRIPPYDPGVLLQLKAASALVSVNALH